ncbi:hypothetical protein [Bacillus sp. SM2101]|uniref:hypothetical protein n=1 Tax=Bacillus sp. SM2101 TaxID=2805366 RepID=UPI001BDF501D|nr:hypothetical protein [Bacillus sp. SM2101]
MVMVILNSTILQFFEHSRIIRQSNLKSYIVLKLHEQRNYYDEEIKELLIICNNILEEIKKGNFDNEVFTFHKKYKIDTQFFTIDDHLEFILHLLHLCKTVLMTDRLLTANCLLSDAI